MAWRAVLIVEYDPQMRAVLRQIFDAAGYACELAADSREALEVFKAGRLRSS
jgi:DNA-binding response OmpR family regulator